MPANSWPEKDSYNELDPLNSMFAEMSANMDLEEQRSQKLFVPSRFQGRRRKAALVLTMVWSGTIALHLVSWGFLIVLGLTTVVGLHALVIVFAKPRSVDEETKGDLPFVSLLVAAKNEELVISNLVNNLCNLEYPRSGYEVWIVDDNSSDNTPELLYELALKYENLKVLRREAGASGGKSGALNQVLPLTKGEVIAVFDADAQVSSDVLLRTIPLFGQDNVGAVQLRKEIANASTNFWTKGQMAEMAVDTFFQERRSLGSGIGELRGNGQFVRRTALYSCGGWNEETITDDLDLTLRLHLDKWDIECVFYPVVKEEGVTNAVSLWHQRNRWAEGGYQRYLDYWDLIVRNRMGTWKTFELLVNFVLIQYIIPTAIIPDFLMAIARHRPPILSPLTGMTVTVSFFGMFAGLKRIHKNKGLKTYTYILPLQSLRGILYMFHWIVVISTTTIRMSIRPKRLKWVKTLRQGSK
ncbi:glycosyltransferase family 2 protein [Plectonema cf. radiosum LEGE 06105]|uniref:Beta-monoglucosyldiacylglycerol synthase n=1 Tax=Plectonema cf. radiosum LEGE 06105 TaxID=945769 RepID=A0A8J7F5L2_9CYAN|nr:glycosyltransferase family 2 protein [Plectonema radiosum]MBE9217026.1 glycosyltransferase family 2 protein [Plectonema cf. radiosum LEGE 06105]